LRFQTNYAEGVFGVFSKFKVVQWRSMVASCGLTKVT
jgi:hypothetical protein